MTGGEAPRDSCQSKSGKTNQSGEGIFNSWIRKMERQKRLQIWANANDTMWCLHCRADEGGGKQLNKWAGGRGRSAAMKGLLQGSREWLDSREFMSEWNRGNKMKEQQRNALVWTISKASCALWRAAHLYWRLKREEHKGEGGISHPNIWPNRGCIC